MDVDGALVRGDDEEAALVLDGLKHASVDQRERRAVNWARIGPEEDGSINRVERPGFGLIGREPVTGGYVNRYVSDAPPKSTSAWPWTGSRHVPEVPDYIYPTPPNEPPFGPIPRLSASSTSSIDPFDPAMPRQSASSNDPPSSFQFHDRRERRDGGAGRALMATGETAFPPRTTTPWSPQLLPTYLDRTPRPILPGIDHFDRAAILGPPPPRLNADGVQGRDFDDASSVSSGSESDEPAAKSMTVFRRGGIGRVASRRVRKGRDRGKVGEERSEVGRAHPYTPRTGGHASNFWGEGYRQL